MKLIIRMVNGDKYVVRQFDRESVMDLVDDLRARTNPEYDEEPESQVVHLEFDDSRDHWWERRRPSTVYLVRDHIASVEIE